MTNAIILVVLVLPNNFLQLSEDAPFSLDITFFSFQVLLRDFLRRFPCDLKGTAESLALDLEHLFVLSFGFEL